MYIKNGSVMGYAAEAAAEATNMVTMTASATDSITLADNTEYFIYDARAFTINQPIGGYSCHLFIETGATAAIEYPETATIYGDDVAEALPGERWEISAFGNTDGYGFWICINWGSIV